MDLNEGLVELARVAPGPTPVVSVYLDTEWRDEQQRDRVRIFLKNELREARRADGTARAADVDLDWIEEQSGALLHPNAAEDARGVALFCLRGRRAPEAPQEQGGVRESFRRRRGASPAPARRGA